MKKLILCGALAAFTFGTQAASATLHLAGQTVPVSRPNLSGDPNTDELFLTLGRAG